MKKIIFLFTLLLFPISFVNSTPKDIEIRTIAFAPLGINNQGELSGIYYELANLITENAGYTANNQLSPYARIIKEIKAGDIDLTIMFRYRDLDPHVQYIAPLPAKKTVVVGLHENSFESISDLSNKKVCYLRGTQYNHKLAFNKAIIKYPVNTYIQCIKMLTVGRVDAITGTFSTIKGAALEVEKTRTKTIEFSTPLILDKKTPWVQVSNKSRDKIDIEKLKESYAQLEEKDTLNALQQKYMP